MNHKFDELAGGLPQSLPRRAALNKFNRVLAGLVTALLGLRRTTCASWLLPVLLLLMLPAAVQAQYTYTTNNGSITITGYTGPGGAVTIPSMIHGLPVTSIGFAAFQVNWQVTSVTIPNSVTSISDRAFEYCRFLTSVTIPDSVTSIGSYAFNNCIALTGITIGNGVTSIGEYAFNQCDGLAGLTIGNSVATIGDRAFASCSKLTSVTLPNSVTNIGDDAFNRCEGLTNVALPDRIASIGVAVFSACTSLASITIPNSVTNIMDDAFSDCGLTSVTIPNRVNNIGGAAFAGCDNLMGVYFQGNAPKVPSVDSYLFLYDNNATVYYLPGTTGWDTTFGDRPTALWTLPNPLILDFGPSFGVQTNKFGFIISWATNLDVVVEACTTLTSPTWSPVATNTLTGGWSYFSDPEWTNYPARFYRLRWP